MYIQGTQIFVGIDPGASGYVAVQVYEPGEPVQSYIEATGSLEGVTYTTRALHAMLRTKRQPVRTSVLMERLTGYVGQAFMGAHGFVLGRSYGWLQSSFELLVNNNPGAVSLYEATPQVWMKQFLGTKPPKDRNERKRKIAECVWTRIGFTVPVEQGDAWALCFLARVQRFGQGTNTTQACANK